MTRFGLSPPAEPRSAGFSVDTRMRLSARSLAAIGRAGCVRRQGNRQPAKAVPQRSTFTRHASSRPHRLAGISGTDAEAPVGIKGRIAGSQARTAHHSRVTASA